MAEGTAGGTEAAPRGLSALWASRHYVLAILTAVYVVSYIDRYIISIVLDEIRREFSVSDSWLGILSGLGFALFYATLGIPIAYWADRSNRKQIIAWSLAIFSVATMLCGAAVQFWQLLIARLLVGVGEAGTSPPSHSMISDLYPPAERGWAMGIFAAGLNIGLMIAFFGGGWVTENYGWRAAFITAGLPGLLLTALILLTIREPVRGLSEPGRAPSAMPPLKVVTNYLISRPTFLHIAAGAALNSFVGYGGSQWVGAFLARAHGMSAGDIGLAIGLIYGIAGGLGTFAGGLVPSLLGGRDVRWYMWFPTLMIVGAIPFGLGFYLVPNTPLALALYLLPAAAGAIYLAPALAMLHAIVPLRMRATTSAVFLFITNIVGLALGPLMVGILSDTFNPMVDVGDRTGEAASAYALAEGLRWSLIVCSVVGLWSALHFYLASRSLKADLGRVEA